MSNQQRLDLQQENGGTLQAHVSQHIKFLWLKPYQQRIKSYGQGSM